MATNLNLETSSDWESTTSFIFQPQDFIKPFSAKLKIYIIIPILQMGHCSRETKAKIVRSVKILSTLYVQTRSPTHLKPQLWVPKTSANWTSGIWSLISRKWGTESGHQWKFCELSSITQELCGGGRDSNPVWGPTEWDLCKRLVCNHAFKHCIYPREVTAEDTRA